MRYAFASPRLGVAEAGRLRVSPTFFRAQPGRRYAVEPRRATSMMTSFDVPTTLVARIELPAGAQIAQAAGIAPPRTGETPYHYSEARQFGVTSSGVPLLTVRRVARLPLMRVAPDAYPAFAQDLRRVDAAEREDRKPDAGPSVRAGDLPRGSRVLARSRDSEAGPPARRV